MHVELRIHGVSGSPPEEVLGGPAVPDERFPVDPPTVHRGDGVLSYRWASQTSGTATSALWLLLVPYMLLNVAGWALPPSPRHRVGVASLRIAGLFLTLVFALVTATGVIGVGAYQVVRPATSWETALLAGILVSVLVIGALWFATTRAEEARNDRPYLRAPHVAVALWGVWAASITAAAEAAGTANPIGSMWILPGALVVLTAAASVWHGLEDVVRVFGRVAVAAVAVLLVSLVVRPVAAAEDLPEVLAGIGGPLRGAVLAYLVAATVATILAWSSSHPDAGPLVGSLLALAGSTGAAVGSGMVVVAGMVFGVSPAPSTGGLAEAFAVGAAAALVVTAVHFWSHLEPGESPAERAMRTLSSVRDDLRPLLTVTPAITLVVGAVALGGFGEALPMLAAVVAPTAGLGVAAVAYRLGYRLAAAIVAGSTALVVFGVAADLVSFRTAAVIFTLILPVVAVVVRVTGAVVDADRRRILAIPWDVGSFFSRRFHPFAPPTYRDSVERELRAVIATLERDGDVVVSAHSQGSVISAAALAGGDGSRRALLTHGSPLATLYTRFFPISFPADVVSMVGTRAWINLWRPTDPIGGPIRGTDDRRIEDRHGRFHGGYWMGDEVEYRRAVADLTTEVPPTWQG